MKPRFKYVKGLMCVMAPRGQPVGCMAVNGEEGESLVGGNHTRICP
jgi:hypothetical protein